LLALLLAIAPSHGVTAETKTSKERLSDKAADEQRVDNCRVPLERRGPVPRPDCDGAMSPAGEARKQRDNETDRTRP
jgi:hypothetical protein